MRKQDKLKSIEEANRRLLGENTITETHVDTDESKMEYIKGALKNLSSENLNKIYLEVEKYDPNYKPNVAKGNYRQSSAPGEMVS